MSEISGRKYVIRIFPTYLAAGRDSNETIITQEQRPKERNPFQLFHTSSRSNYGQKMEFNRLEHMERFPRQFDFPTEICCM
jgi:hypothetical protein